VVEAVDARLSFAREAHDAQQSVFASLAAKVSSARNVSVASEAKGLSSETFDGLFGHLLLRGLKIGYHN
jgi:hypothetical protein